MQAYSALEVSKFFLSSFQAPRLAISNLKLQKLIYYAQAWHLALYGDGLFDDKIEAWVHGPVVPKVFREYKQYGWNPIPKVIKAPIPKDLSLHLKDVLRVYGKFDAVALERLTHQEAPWRDARAGLAPDEPSNRVITNEAMRTFYSARLNAQA